MPYPYNYYNPYLGGYYNPYYVSPYAPPPAPQPVQQPAQPAQQETTEIEKRVAALEKSVKELKEARGNVSADESANA